MGVKSNVAAPSLVISNDSQSTTPSTTPMRPTPLTGNWGDYEWGMDIKDAVIESTTEKVCVEAPPMVPQPEPQHMTSIVPRVNTVTPVTAVPAVQAVQAVSPAQFIPVYQGSPQTTDSWDYSAATPEYMSQTQSFNEQYMQQHNPYSAPAVRYDAPVQQPQLQQQQAPIRRFTPQQRYTQPQFVPQQRRQTSQPNHARQQQPPQQAPARQQQQPQQARPLQVSRFAPPPPPPSKADYVFTKNGSADDAFYRIVMRWYERVVVAQRAHTSVAPCPAAEHYLHDFAGWLVEVDLWWKKHFANRKGRPHRNHH